MAESTHADDGDLLAGSGAPVLERRVQRDASAQQWSSYVELDALGNREYEALRDDDVSGIPTLGGGAVRQPGVVRLRHTFEAVLLLTGEAGFAFTAGVDEAADTDAVADLVLGDLGADLGDDSGDLVAGNDGVGRAAPLVACGVDVGVADARELDLDEDVLRTELAPLDGDLLERRVRCGRCVCGS